MRTGREKIEKEEVKRKRGVETGCGDRGRGKGREGGRGGGEKALTGLARPYCACPVAMEPFVFH